MCIRDSYKPEHRGGSQKIEQREIIFICSLVMNKLLALCSQYYLFVTRCSETNLASVLTMTYDYQIGRFALVTMNRQLPDRLE